MGERSYSHHVEKAIGLDTPIVMDVFNKKLDTLTYVCVSTSFTDLCLNLRLD